MNYAKHAMLVLLACAVITSCASTPIQRGGGEDGATERTGAKRHGKGKGTFNATLLYTLDVPEGAGKVRAWFAMPQRHDPDQKIEGWKVESDLKTSVVKDKLGNEFLHVELTDAKPGAHEIKATFTVTRHEISMPTDPALTRPHTPAELEKLVPYLKEQKQGAVTDEIRAMAENAVADETNPLRKGKLLYDAVLGHVEYWVKDPGNLKSSGVGSATYTYEKCTGNCTDFHALYQALCVAAKLPCRTVYGSFFKSPLDGVDRDQSYHCWLEVHAPNVGWVPLDVAMADIFVEGVELNDENRELIRLTVADDYTGPDAKLVEYYWGNLEHRRVTWHEGRDLEIGAEQGPVNFLPWTYVEVNGKTQGIARRKLTFTEKK